MSWITDNLLPNFNNPQSMAQFGALGNMLMAGGTPMRGTGMGAGNALAMLAGAGMQGAQTGANAAQEFQKSDIANQMGQLGLEKQQALQPLQINMIKNAMNGINAPGSLSGGPSGSQGNFSQADQMFNQAYNLALASGDMAKASAVLQSWAEHNPSLAGQIANEQHRNSIVALPGGRQVPGSNILPAYGSPVPQIGQSSLPPIPSQSVNSPIPMPPLGGNQVPSSSIPPVQGSQLNIPSNNTPTSTGIDPNDPVAMANATEAAKEAAQVAAAAPKAQATETGKNIAESDRAVTSIIGRLPNAFSIVDKMSALAPQVPYGPAVESQRDLLNALKKPGANAYDQFNKFNENLFTQELPAIVQNSGGRIDVPLVKSIQAASSIPLDAQPASKLANLANTKDLLQKVRDNALATYKAQTGQDFDLGRAFTTKEQVIEAIRTGVITKAQGIQIFQTHHGMK